MSAPIDILRQEELRLLELPRRDSMLSWHLEAVQRAIPLLEQDVRPGDAGSDYWAPVRSKLRRAGRRRSISGMLLPPRFREAVALFEAEQ